MKKRKQTKLNKRHVLNEKGENSSETLDASDIPVQENTSDEVVDVANENIDSHSSKKKKLKKMATQRSEACADVSEFNLTEVGKETIKLNELIKTSQKLSGTESVKKQLKNVKKLQSLSVPLSKPQMTKIKRTMGYTKICDELKRWEPVVRNNRAAEQVIFPLKKPEVQLENFESAAEKYVLKHPVAVAVDELLQKSENVFQKDKPMTEAEEKALKAMSLEEAKQRHAELMKHRALISYQEAKARRQNKIKSKRYHRLLKKEKMKKLMKEFEELERTDAAKALEKLMEADKLRILERMTLKHRNTGKWAKMQKLRAKYLKGLNNFDCLQLKVNSRYSSTFIHKKQYTNGTARSRLKEDLQIGLKLKEKLPTVEKNISKLKASLERNVATELETDELAADEIRFGSTFPESSDIVPVTELLEENSIPNFSRNNISNAEAIQDTNELIDKLCIVKHAQSTKMSADQKVLAEQNQQIAELENERQMLKEQLNEVSHKFEHLAGLVDLYSFKIHWLDSKIRDLESKLELEQTTKTRLESQIARLKEQNDRAREECDSLRNKEIQAQEGVRRLQRQLRDLREDYSSLQQKEADGYRKQHELEMALENMETDLQVTKNDLRLACQRIQDLQNALEDDLDSGTDVPDDSGSDSDSSFELSVLRNQSLTPVQRCESIASNLSYDTEGRQSRTSSFTQELSAFSRMMLRRMSMDFQ
ncbi:U3 small nucleolar RNA-associated protein 14 like protein [Argiope bruennichi]|uniref:U3 small nucleolar RNA-associated protein 14 like protein n=1 Tax=Argiope bruennichi TaxID=94029 RepID=A0A8T0FXB7_ARGBR|nr:U3 small nucleolar RNA-associated protein 14 like protein [Argiope bruennichi]